MSDDYFALVLEFDAGGEFVRGFEAGRVWGKLGELPTEQVVEIVHATNAEMFLRMGESLDRLVQSTELDETWIEISFGPAGEPERVELEDE